MWQYVRRASEFLFPSPDIQWRQILCGAVAVVAVTRRSTGLWALPTSKLEKDMTFSPPGGEEDHLRSSDPFGSESVTVTWNALVALKETVDRYPDGVARNVRWRLSDFLDVDFAYGRPLPGLKGGTRVNASARHSAMAVLIQRQISPEPPEMRIRLLSPTVRWLLDHQSAQGGWPYEQINPKSDEPLATAYCICALSCFFTDLEKDGQTGTDFATEIQEAVSRGFDALKKMKTKTFWSGSYENMAVEDSADIIEMLSFGVRNGSLAKLKPEAQDYIARLCSEFIGFAKDDGWPDSWNGKTSSIAATIAARFTLGVAAAELIADRGAELATKVDNSIVRQIARDRLGKELKSWDWSMLARLAGTKNTKPLSQKEIVDLFYLVERVRRHASKNALSRLSLLGIPTLAHEAILYSMTGGQVESVRPIGLQSSIDLLPRSIRLTIGPVLGWAVGMFHDKIGEVLKRIIGLLWH